MTKRTVDFLLVGIARSGTTLGQRMLSELTQVWIPPETHFWRYARALAERFEVPLDLATAEESMRWFSDLSLSEGLNLDPVAVATDLTEPIYLWDLFTAIVDHLSPEGMTILGEKTPDHVMWTPRLLDAHDRVSVVGVVRDPREVYRSHLGVPWGIRDPWVFAEKWLDSSRTLSDIHRLYPDRVLVTRYEDIVSDPDRFVERFAELVGSAMTRVPIADKLGDDVKLFPDEEQWKHTALEAVSQREDQWPEAIGSAAISAIEAVAGNEMGTWGYDTSGISRGSSTPPTTPALLEVRRAGMRARLDPLPITEGSMTAWHRDPAVKASRWEATAIKHLRSLAELNSTVAAQKDAAKDAQKASKDAAEWKKLATDLTASNREMLTALTQSQKKQEDIRKDLARASGKRDEWHARTVELNDQHKALRKDLARVTGKRDQWHARAVELNDQHKALVAEHRQADLRHARDARSLALARHETQRLRARRWWRLAGVLGRWRRRPWRIDKCLVELWRLRSSQPLPSVDVSKLDERIASLEELTARAATSPAESTIAKARGRFNQGDYEAALAELSLGEEGRSPEGRRLARDCHIRMGALSKALAEVHRLRAQTKDRSYDAQARYLTGRIRETATAWLPDAGPAGPSNNRDPSSKRILHILKESLPFFERGYTIRSHATLLAQAEAGFRPYVITSLGFPRAQGFANFESLETVDGIPHYRLDLGDAYEADTVPFDLLLSDQAVMTSAIADAHPPAVVQAGSGYRGYETALVGLSVARRLDVPMVYEMRSFLEQTWTAEANRAEVGEHYNRRFSQEVRCLTEAQMVLTICESMKGEIAERGIPAEKIGVVPNVVDADRFRAREKRRDLADRYSLGDRPLLGYISNLGWREGIENLIRAVGVLRGRGHDIGGIVAGTGPEEAALQALVDELHLGDVFKLLGHVPNAEIEDHYALIDVFVVPRVDDRASRLVTPLKPLEAMAMEIPVIASNLDALAELTGFETRGLLFRPSDPDSLADAAERILSDQALRDSLTKSARQWIEEDRTISANAARYAELIGSLL